MQGWISLHRSIWENWIWKDKPFSKGQAWIDILLMVNHEKGKAYFRDAVYDVERGQKITSELKLADRWGWSRNKVRKFLDDLKTEQMIDIKRDKRKTVIEVVNYSKYQDSNTTKGTTESTTEGTTESQQKDINNNDNNENKNNNNDYKSVFGFYLSLNLIKHRTYTNDMAKAIKKAIKDNKYTIEYCKELLKRHAIVVEKTKSLQYPVKARGLAEFFGQKVYGGTHLICSEYDEGGKYYEQYIKDNKINDVKGPLKLVIRDTY